MALRELPAAAHQTQSSHTTAQMRTHLIFLMMMRNIFASLRRAARKFLSARVEIKIVQSPKPSTLSKYSAAFFGCTMGYAAGTAAVSGAADPNSQTSRPARALSWLVLVVPQEQAPTLSQARWNGDIDVSFLSSGWNKPLGSERPPSVCQWNP